MTSELELDHLFWNAISTNLEFQSWFLQRTKFAEQTIQLVTNEKWHQRWYRDPDTNKDSETDILLIFRDSMGDDRYAIHVENKPPNRMWEPQQPENYRKRAEDRKSKWRYVDYQTALIAPLSFLNRWPREVEQFDIAISYEEIANFVPEFGRACTGIDVDPTEPQPLELHAVQALLHGLIRSRILEFKADPTLELPDLASMIEGKQTNLWFPIPNMAGGFQIELVQRAANEFTVLAESGSRIWDGWMRHKVTLFNVRSEPYDYMEEPLFDEWVASQAQS